MPFNCCITAFSHPPFSEEKTIARSIGDSESLLSSTDVVIDKTTSIAIAIEILEVINSASDIFPPLKSVTTIALHIAKTTESFHNSKEDWLRLSSHIEIYTATIMKHIQEDNNTDLDDWNALIRIQSKITRLRTQGFTKRLWSHFKTNGQFVKELHRDFDDAIKLCHFQAALMTTTEVLRNLKSGNPNKISETLLQRFKDEIGFEIERIVGLGRLPDTRGASWNTARTCLIGTRVAHRKETNDWIRNFNKRTHTEMFLVVDSMGSGKSALAHSICQQAQQEHWLVACFFFNRANSEESTSRHLFGSLIRGLCRVNEGARDAIARIFKSDDTLPIAPPTRLFQEVILPVCDVLPKSVPLVVVIDALDEGYDVELLKILRDGIPLLPTNLCFVVTTRPENRVMHWLEGMPHVRRSAFSLIQGRDTQQDIAKHVQNRLRNPPFDTTTFPPKLIKDFVDRSEGVFLWAETVLVYLESDDGPLKCDAALMDIISSTQRHPGAEAKMDELYDQILSRFQWSDKALAAAYRAFMGAIITSPEPISLNTLTALYAGQGEVDSDSLSEIARRLRPILDNFYPEARDRPIRLLHLSAREYLTQRVPASKPCHLDIEECNRIAALITIAIIDEELQPTIPCLGFTSGDWDIFHIPWIPKLPPSSISEKLSYSCRFVVDHILRSGPNGPIPASQLCDFISRHARPLLETTAAMGHMVDVGSLRAWIETSSPRLHDELCEGLSLDAELAKALTDVGFCMRRAGRHSEALVALQRAMVIYRRLASKDPSGFEHAMAKCLISEGVCLGDFKRDEEAAASLGEAVSILSKLAAEASDETFEADLGRALNNFSCRLGSLGRHEEALERIEEALSIYKGLSERYPRKYEPHVGWTLINQASRQAFLNHQGDALKSSQESVAIYRRLAEEDHETYDSILYFALHSLSIRLDSSGRHPMESIGPLKDAVAAYHRLAVAEPAAFEPELARSLDTLSVRFTQLKRYEDALTAIQEAVAIFRRLAVVDPAVFEGDLAGALDSLCLCCNPLERYEDGLAAIEEAVGIYTKLVESRRSAFESSLAYSLNTRSVVYYGLGRKQEALQSAEASVDIYRRLIQARPLELAANFGDALDTLSAAYHHMDRYEEGLIAEREAVEMYRREVLDDPSPRPLTRLANGLKSLAISLTAVEKKDEALHVVEEEIKILHQLSMEEPGTFDDKLAPALYHYCETLRDVNRFEDALQAVKESIGIYRVLAARDPDPFHAHLEEALLKEYKYLSAMDGRADEADEVWQEYMDM